MPAAGPGPLARVADAIARLTGRSATPHQTEQFRRYLDLLIQWNRTHRLTGLRSPEAIVDRLFVDSLLFLTQLPPGTIRIADIGAGAGVPSMPLRIAEPRIAPTLIESRRKPVSFLRALTRELALSDVRVVEGRAERVLVDRPELVGAFDAVTSRAVGGARELLATAMSYLRPGGVFVAAGPPAERIQQHPLPPAGAEWRTVPFPALRVTRVFLVARKSA